MLKPLTVVHISSEVEPYSKTGGLANVLGSLPRAHAELGHRVLVITPYYGHSIDATRFPSDIIAHNVPIEVSPGIVEEVTFRRLTEPSQLDTYFIEHLHYFGVAPNPNNPSSLYGSPHENQRYMLFNVAALQLLKFLNIQPDILHCHDWHTGLIPYFLKGRYKKDDFWKNTATLFTIHNLNFQLGHNWWEIPQELRDTGHTALPPFNDPSLEYVNFAKRAIQNANAINAVSETYREEILTADFGQELHRILKNKEKIVFGIVNGIDYDAYNPLTDPGLHTHYSDKSVGRKKYNKRWLQKYYKLEINDKIPLICMTSRIVEQKGFKLLMSIAHTIMSLNIQLIIMGDGDETMAGFWKQIQKQYPDKCVVVPFDRDRETSVYAGSDMFLLPSRFEPCGLNQMIAMRYGCVPIVHHIGGLADTIIDYDPQHKVGNGFAFKRFSPRFLLIALVRAIETWKHKKLWNSLVVSDLKQANSWSLPAQKYIELYKTALKLKRKTNLMS